MAKKSKKKVVVLKDAKAAIQVETDPVDVEELRPKEKTLKELFWVVVKQMKKPKDLTKKEIRAIITRVGFLDDNERAYYKSILVRENLTTEDYDRYGKLQLIDVYFPMEV